MSITKGLALVDIIQQLHTYAASAAHSSCPASHVLTPLPHVSNSADVHADIRMYFEVRPWLMWNVPGAAA